MEDTYNEINDEIEDKSFIETLFDTGAWFVAFFFTGSIIGIFYLGNYLDLSLIHI